MQASSNLLNVKNSKRIVITIFLLVLACTGVFGQTNENSSVINNDLKIEVLNSNEKIAATNSDIEFMNWFMGSKQSQSLNSKELIDATRNTKKQMIISGGTPNRVLYRTFVKKVVSIENATV